MGPLNQLHGSLPTVGNSTFLEPVQILERRLVKRGNRPATQVLVHWANSFPEDATWEYLHDLQESSIRVGAIPVAVPTFDDPNLVPSGISFTDPMVETRSSNTRRLEEMLTAAMTDLTAKLSDADRRREKLDKIRDQFESKRDLSLRQLREEFLAMQLQQNEIMNRFVTPGGGGHAQPVGGAGGFQARQQQYFATRQSKVGFPPFSGEDLAGWIIRSDHFFTVDLTSEESKVRLAIINFEGREWQWFQNWAKY